MTEKDRRESGASLGPRTEQEIIDLTVDATIYSVEAVKAPTEVMRRTAEIAADATNEKLYLEENISTKQD